MATITPEQGAQILMDVGFSASQAVVMLAIAHAENGGGELKTDSISATNDFGWLNIHSAFSAGPPGWRNPKTNAAMARAKFLTQGYNAWCTYYPTGCNGHARNNPAHLRHTTYLSQSQATVSKVKNSPIVIPDDAWDRGWGNPAQDLPDPVGDVKDLLAALTKGETWLRISEVIAGGLCLAIAFWMLAKETPIGESALAAASSATGGIIPADDDAGGS